MKQSTTRVLHDRAAAKLTRDAAALKHARRVERAVQALGALQPGEYEDVMIHFCRACGANDPSCQCWNDE